MRTFTPKPGDVERQWHVIDASDVVLGRLASQAARLLRGKHKPVFAPHIDTGDYVIVVNAGKIALTGSKRDQKLAYRHSGFPGGLRATPYSELLAPSVVLFGPAPVERWGPPTTGPHVALTDARLRGGDAFGDEPDPALLAVTPSDVLAAAATLLPERVSTPDLPDVTTPR